VPEDRFGDLGERDERSAAEKLAELDERDPEPDHPSRKPPEPARPSGRYMWVVGVAALILVVVVGAHQLRSGEGTFIKGPPDGQPLPEFAAPLVDGPDKDANIVPRSSKSSKVTPACNVKVPGSLNICDQEDKPVVLSFLFLRGADCEPQLDRLDRVARRQAGQVNVIGVFFERDRDKVRDHVKKHGWGFPIVVDRDGAISNLYAVGGCPTTVFADKGGRVRTTRTGNLSEAQLEQIIAGLKR
jgi:peroxiredoxin